jgi:predicted GH43/DUF377 family glycosyl hydrolase
MKLLFLLEDVDESKRPAGQLEDLCVDFLKDTFASDESSSRSFSIAPHSNVNDSHNEDITVRNGGKEYRIDVKMLKANGGSRKIGSIMKGTHLPIPALTAASRTAVLDAAVSNYANCVSGYISKEYLNESRSAFIRAKFMDTDYFMTKVNDKVVVFDFDFLMKHAKLNTNLRRKGSGSSDISTYDDPVIDVMFKRIFNGRFEGGSYYTSSGSRILAVSEGSSIKYEMVRKDFDTMTDFFNKSDSDEYSVHKNGGSVQYQIDDKGGRRGLTYLGVDKDSSLHVFRARRLAKAKEGSFELTGGGDTFECWIDLSSAKDALLAQADSSMKAFKERVKGNADISDESMDAFVTSLEREVAGLSKEMVGSGMMTHRDTATDFKKTATALEMVKDKLRKMGRDASDESVAAMMRRASDERRAGKIINVGRKEDSGLLSVKEKDPAYEAMRRLLKK